MAKGTAKKKAKAKASKVKVKRARAKLPARKKAKKLTKIITKKATKKAAVKKTLTTRKIQNAKAHSVATKTPAQKAVATLTEGQMAPDFTLTNQNGDAVSLSSYRGKNVVLYFYPKDDTPGCTKEACSFRDNIGAIDQTNTTILGVSFDDQASHQKFIEKYGLNFQLLSDSDKAIAQAYGCYVQKNMYGNISWGIERSTFVIDKDGRIAKIWRRVSVDGHTEDVLQTLRALA